MKYLLINCNNKLTSVSVYFTFKAHINTTIVAQGAVQSQTNKSQEHTKINSKQTLKIQ